MTTACARCTPVASVWLVTPLGSRWYVEVDGAAYANLVAHGAVELDTPAIPMATSEPQPGKGDA